MRILDSARDLDFVSPHSGRWITPDATRLQEHIDQLQEHVQQLEEERASLRWMADHDALTGLANRRLFHTLAPALLQHADRSTAVLILDLNGFKPINDAFGHHVGDQVLCVIGRRMAGCLGDQLVARLGGDEFAALACAPHTDAPDAWWHALAATLSAAIAPPIDVAGHTVTVTASIGVVPAGPSADLVVLLHRADQAMFEAKRHGRDAGRPGTTWVVGGGSDDQAMTYQPATVPPDPAVSESGVAYRPKAQVWVHRDGIRRAGVVEAASEWAALVRYRCSAGAGTMVDTIRAACLTRRAETDPQLDSEAWPFQQIKDTA